MPLWRRYGPPCHVRRAMRRFGSVRPHSPLVIDRRWNDVDVSYGRRGDPPIGDALAGNEFYIEQVVNDFSHTRVLEPLYRAVVRSTAREPDGGAGGGGRRRHRPPDGSRPAAYQQASAAARRRGALAEARTNLSLAVAQLDRWPPGTDRDRREMAVRLERGFLATAGEGGPGPESASDFERCLRLGKADLRDDEVFATAELTEQAERTVSTYGGWSGPPSRPPSKPWPRWVPRTTSTRPPCRPISAP